MLLHSLMKKANSRRADKVPAGFKTVHQYANSENLSSSQARKILLACSKTVPPLVERRTFKICVDGILRPIPHYRKLK